MYCLRVCTVPVPVRIVKKNARALAIANANWYFVYTEWWPVPVCACTCVCVYAWNLLSPTLRLYLMQTCLARTHKHANTHTHAHSHASLHSLSSWFGSFSLCSGIWIWSLWNETTIRHSGSLSWKYLHSSALLSWRIAMELSAVPCSNEYSCWCMRACMHVISL